MRRGIQSVVGLLAFLVLLAPVDTGAQVPGESCMELTEGGWTLEICGAVAAAGHESSQAVSVECHSTVLPGAGAPQRTVVATGVKCRVLIDGVQFGDSQGRVFPGGGVAAADFLGFHSIADVDVCLEGLALFDDFTVLNAGEECFQQG